MGDFRWGRSTICLPEKHTDSVRIRPRQRFEKTYLRDDRYYGVRLTSSCSFSKLGSEPIQPKQNSHTTIDDCSFGNVRKNFRFIVVDRSDYISQEPTHFIATNSLPHYTLHIIFMHISTTPHHHTSPPQSSLLLTRLTPQNKGFY